MTKSTLLDYSTRLCEFIARTAPNKQGGSKLPIRSPHGMSEESVSPKHASSPQPSPPSNGGEGEIDDLALELFELQFAFNPPYRRFCEARGVSPTDVSHWTQIPAIPASAFKELVLTSLAPAERTRVFHSSGTTGQKPSRHFHSVESLAAYEISLSSWFKACLRPDLEQMIFLTPPPALAPHSSLVHMFAVLYGVFGGPQSLFTGGIDANGGWVLNLHQTRSALVKAAAAARPVTLLGTAFNFVHLLDHLAEAKVRLQLPPGSRALETGGYKGRSRVLAKSELHALITKHLGIPVEGIVCEYGMSELSSQAYDRTIQNSSRVFQFPPWARAQMISPETGREVREGETGLIRVFDLANVWSVMAIQTEDLGIKRGFGFELIGRSTLAEPRGCSLMVG